MTKISLLTLDTDLSSSDLLALVDQTGPTTKRTTLSTLTSYLNSNLNFSSDGWQPVPSTLTYSSNLGNREFVFGTSTDLSGSLSTGMKLSVVRSVTPSTQCMSFTAASSQYATKASPTGITFTSAFTCEAWIYLNSYTGTNQWVISRSDNSTGGFLLRLTPSGQIDLVYGSSSSFTTSTSYQSVPLKRWVHIAGVVSSVSSKIAFIYINGQVVPFSQTGTATTLTQTGNLSIGAANTGVASTFFDGFIYQPRVWSVARNQTNIRDNMGLTLTTASNLVFTTADSSFNDASGVGNNLTAENGASATATGNPFNAIEYGFITTLSSSSITIRSVNGVIPAQTLDTPQYSLMDSPYGWPSTSTSLHGHRLLELPFQAQQTTTSTTSASFGGSDSSGDWWPVTIPANCSRIRIKAFNTSVSNPGGVTVFGIFDGSNRIGQINQNNSNNFLSTEMTIPVTPGSTIDFNIAWDVTAGTATWAATTGSEEQGFFIEAA